MEPVGPIAAPGWREGSVQSGPDKQKQPLLVSTHAQPIHFAAVPLTTRLCPTSHFVELGARSTQPLAHSMSAASRTSSCATPRQLARPSLSTSSRTTPTTATTRQPSRQQPPVAAHPTLHVARAPRVAAAPGVPAPAPARDDPPTRLPNLAASPTPARAR